MAHPKLAAIRKRYSYRCGYCGVSEIDVGGELTVDHFHPTSAGGDDTDDNLVYACIRCNQAKGAQLPYPTLNDHDKRLLHPLLDDMTAHIVEVAATGRLEGVTVTGTFHIEALRLNRNALVVNRQRRRLRALLEAKLAQTLVENDALRQSLVQRDTYVVSLEDQIRKDNLQK